MTNLLETDAALRSMADAILASRQDAAQAFEAMLTEAAKVILGAVPYDAPDWEQKHSPESLCDGLLADLSGKTDDVLDAVQHFLSCVDEFNSIINKAGLTPMERTVIIRRYIDGIKDNWIINETDGYANAGTFFNTAAAKISDIIERK